MPEKGLAVRPNRSEHVAHRRDGDRVVRKERFAIEEVETATSSTAPRRERITSHAAFVAMALVVALGGCASETGEAEQAAERPADRDFVPSHLDQVYQDGRIAVRYPKSWTRSSSDRFGVVLGDNSGRHSGFVSIRYVSGRELPPQDRFADFAAIEIRPGGRLLPLYTQAARVDGIRGFEAAFIWPMAGTRGPLFRAYGFDRGTHGVAFIVFASENPETHATDFGWVKRAIVWMREPRNEGPRARPGGSFEHGY
jgi:hypothetical protein